MTQEHARRTAAIVLAVLAIAAVLTTAEIWNRSVYPDAAARSCKRVRNAGDPTPDVNKRNRWTEGRDWTTLKDPDAMTLESLASLGVVGSSV